MNIYELNTALWQLAVLLAILLLLRILLRRRVISGRDLRLPAFLLVCYVIFQLVHYLPRGMRIDALVLTLASSPILLLRSALPVAFGFWLFKMLSSEHPPERGERQEEQAFALDSGTEAASEVPEEADLRTGVRATPRGHANIRVASLLRRRTRGLKTVASALLATILISILAGFWVFSSAGELATRDQRALLSALQENRKTLVERRTFYGAFQDNLTLLIERISDIEARYQVGAARDSRTLHDLRRLVEEITALRERLLTLETHLSSSLDGFDESLKAIAGNIDDFKASQNQAHILISTVTTRIGSVLLLIFLVQILVTAYRYNSKLGAHYEARADALELEVHSGLKLTELVPSLSPEGITYGKESVAPNKEVIDLIKIFAADRK